METIITQAAEILPPEIAKRGCLQPLGQGMLGNGITQAIDDGYRCVPELCM